MYHAYPNFSFRAYVVRKYREKKIFSTNHFSLRLLQVFPFLIWDIIRYAFVELLLVAVFCLILHEMSQGRDMIVSFFEPGGLFSSWRLILTTLSIILYSVSMWIFPAYIFELTDRYNRNNIRSGKTKSAFWKHLFFVHRMLSMIPFWGFALLIHHQLSIQLLLTGLIVLESLCLFVFYDTRALKNFRKPMRDAVLIVTLLLLLFILHYYQVWYFEVKAAYSLFLICLSGCLYMLYFQVDCSIITEKIRKKPERGYFPVNTFIYSGLFIVNLLLVCGLLWFFDLNAVVPESLMLAVFSAYVFFLDFIYYITNIRREIRYIFNGTLIIFGGGLLIFGALPNFSHYEMECPPVKAGKEVSLGSMEDYYKEWVPRIRENKTNHPYPIILVAGEGGGSRAGFWFTQSMLELDLRTSGKFRDHLFSLSTVSGSSVGAGALLSWWQYTQDHNLKHSDERWRNYPREVFSHNYIGSGLHGLMTTDFWKCFVPFVHWRRDRNDELQDQESVCIQRALDAIRNGTPTGKPTLFNRYRPSAATDSLLLMKRNFTDFYYTSNQSISARYPLIFLNTCRSDDGRRGIFAPIQLSEDDFMDAIDMCRFIYSDTFTTNASLKRVRGLHASVSLATACNTTELFPFFSAPAFVHNLGNFVDGGYYENSGLKTTLEVRRRLLQLLQKDHFREGKDFRIYILYIKNVRFGKDYYPDTAELSAPMLQPAFAITNVPFNSNSSYYEELASRVLEPGYFIRFQLQYLVPPDYPGKDKRWSYRTSVSAQIDDDIFTYNPIGGATTINFPLARWLSRSIIDKMENCYEGELKRNKGLLQLVDRINAEK